MLNLVNFLVALSAAAVLAEFPKNITKCHRSDEDCYKQVTEEIMKTYSSGSDELNLMPIDPLHVASMNLERNPDSPINIDLKFKNLDVIGLRTAQLEKLKGFNFKERTVLEAVVPELLLKGDYTGNGRVLILPIMGKGKSLITCKNIHLKYAFDLKPVDKNGEIYATLKNVKLEFKPELVQYHFEGLFNGNKALTDNMNKFLNENWRDIYNELEGGFATALSLIVKQLINNVLSKYPFDDLFLKVE